MRNPFPYNLVNLDMKNEEIMNALHKASFSGFGPPEYRILPDLHPNSPYSNAADLADPRDQVVYLTK